MNRTISASGISLIASYEGLRLDAYLCPAGVWTIGYGHTAGVKKGDRLKSENEARELLDSDLSVYAKAVNNYDNIYHWTQNEFDALVSFAFNCGTGNLKNLLKDGKRSRTAIETAWCSYNKSRGVALPGLTRRRNEEKLLFRKPDKIIEYYPIYTGESVVLDEVLTAIGAASDYDSNYKNYQKRVPVAEVNGISPYKGTAKQNIELLTRAKEGVLIKP